MLKVTDYMVNYVNIHILDRANVTKDEIKVFETYVDLAMYLYDDDLKAFLNDLEEECVWDSKLSLLENFFCEHLYVFHDESYDYIYYLG